MEVLSLALTICVAILSLTAIICFRIKYAGTREIDRLKSEVEALNKKLEDVDAEAIKDLKIDVKALRNHYGLASRK